MPSKDGKSSKHRRSGWEEAGAEFYQEAYPLHNIADGTVPSKIEAVLPSRVINPATLRTLHLKQRRRSLTHRKTARPMNKDHTLVEQGCTDAELIDLSSDQIANEQEAYEELLLIRDMVLPMHLKRDRRKKLQNAPILRSEGLASAFLRHRKFQEQAEKGWKEMLSKLGLWQSLLKHIEGHYGIGMASYFMFVRWLLFLNVFLSVLMVSFLLVPYLLAKEHTDFEMLCSNSTENNTVACCSAEYSAILHNESVEYRRSLRRELTTELLLEGAKGFVEGTGWLEYTILFYGYYDNQTLEFDSSHVTYNFPLAYVLTALFAFIFCFMLLVQGETQSFKEHLATTKGGDMQYCSIIFGSWDFCITDKNITLIKRKQIKNELLSVFDAEKRKTESSGMSQRQRLKLYFLRLAIKILVLGVLALAGYLIYLATDFSLRQLSLKESEQLQPQILFQYLPTLTITGMNLVFPVFFNFITIRERYFPLQTVRVILYRTVFVRLATVLVLVGSVYRKVSCGVQLHECASEECDTPLCWETFLGQQLYRLALTDFVVALVNSLIVSVCRTLCYKFYPSKVTKLIGEIEFSIPQHTLDLVYGQTLCWMGLFYAPLLPIIAIIRCICFFYNKFFLLKVICVPSTLVYRASRSKSFFMGVLLLGFLVSVIPVIFFVAEVVPSRSCGPFRGMPSAWSVVPVMVEGWPSWVKTVMKFFTTSAFTVPLIVILLLGMYYYWALASAHIAMTKVLKDQLLLEGKDKQYLLNRYNHITQNAAS